MTREEEIEAIRKKKIEDMSRCKAQATITVVTEYGQTVSLARTHSDYWLEIDGERTPLSREEVALLACGINGFI